MANPDPLGKGGADTPRGLSDKAAKRSGGIVIDVNGPVTQRAAPQTGERFEHDRAVWQPEEDDEGDSQRGSAAEWQKGSGKRHYSDDQEKEGHEGERGEQPCAIG